MPPKKPANVKSGTPQNKDMKPCVKGPSPDKKENPELSMERHKEKDAEFVALCKSLRVTGMVCDRAWTLWKTIQESMDKIPDTQTRIWGACLFVTVIDLEFASFTLTEVQKVVDLNVKEFLGLVRKLDVNLDAISSRVDSAITRLEKKYDTSLALYQRFEKTCNQIFALASDGKEKETLRYCWTMFLLAKGRALQMEDDLVISFQLLLCVLEFFIKRCPANLLQTPFKTAVKNSRKCPTRRSSRNQSKVNTQHPEPEVDVELLDILCQENDCSLEEVKNVYADSFTIFLDSLDLSRSLDLPQPELQVSSVRNSMDCAEKGLYRSTTSLANYLNKLYEEHYLKSRDFDGRLFLDGDETLLPPRIEPRQVERTPKKNQSEEEPVVIPPQTPVRAAMNSIQQLKGALPSIGDQPSANLAMYFKNCTVDPTEEVLKRVDRLEQLFGQRFGQAVGPHCVAVGKQRFSLGVRLYYRVMESMLKSEEKRLSVQNFSKLLNDSTFHTSLLACALEVIMATYGGTSFKTGGYKRAGSSGGSAETDLCFPWILDVFQLAAFDFFKVIESFIKAEPTLSKDIVKHLESCEHLVIETLAWSTGSPLFELLNLTQKEGSAVQVETPATFSQPLQHNHTAADLYLSPTDNSHRIVPVPASPATPSSSAASQAPSQPASQAGPQTPSQPASQAGPQTPSQPASQAGPQTPRHPRSNSLSLFYKKLYRLAYMRLKMLSSHLLPAHPELEPIMWTLFQHTLQHEYELMKDRHLDQLMMSTMYAICRVKNVDLRFRTIVLTYKTMPNTNQETFKHVLISEGHYDSIIAFYNQVFMQKLKTNILQYASTWPPPLSPIPHMPRSPYKFPNSPLRVPGSNNVYISPLKSPRRSPGIMTPRTRMLVSIGESFGLSNSFQKINQMLHSCDLSFKRTLDMGPGPKPLKRLRFDVDGQDEADGSKTGGDSTLLMKLAEMSSTRSRMQEQKMEEDAESGKL